MLLQSAVPRFLQFLEFDTNVSQNTVKAYRSDIKQFLSHAGNIDPNAMSPSAVTAFLASLREASHCSDNTIRRKLASIRRFFGFLQDSGFSTDSQLSRIGVRFKAPKRLPKVMPLRDVGRLLLSARGQEHARGYRRYKGARDCIIVGMLFYTGMRISEIVGLDNEDIDGNSGTIRVHGKGGKDRVLYIRNPELEESLGRYSVLRGRLGCDTEALFVNRVGGRLSSRSVETIFHLCLERAGISDSYTPHSMRHTMATTLLERGINIRALQEILGHSSILSTQIYTHVAPQQVDEALTRLGQLSLE
jgi:integrase/recombinase XerD